MTIGILALVGIVVTTVGGYLAGKRTTSGEINTSPAETLWASVMDDLKRQDATIARQDATIEKQNEKIDALTVEHRSCLDTMAAMRQEMALAKVEAQRFAAELAAAKVERSELTIIQRRLDERGGS